ncbi:MAG: hypothetical protein WAW91_03635 [Candidatus Nanoperiomorbaceae bacterium]
MSRQKVNLRQILPRKTERACGKNRYATRVEAETVATQQMIIFANSQPDLKLSVYKCGFCGGWHLTSHRGND